MIKSPRFLRPHTVTVKHHIGEDAEGREQLEVYDIQHVKFSYSKSASYSQNGTSNSDQALLVIDMNDYECSHDAAFNLCINDIVEFNGQEFTITSVVPINPLRNAPEFLEVNLG